MKQITQIFLEEESPTLTGSNPKTLQILKSKFFCTLSSIQGDIIILKLKSLIAIFSLLLSSAMTKKVIQKGKKKLKCQK